MPSSNTTIPSGAEYLFRILEAEKKNVQDAPDVATLQRVLIIRNKNEHKLRGQNFESILADYLAWKAGSVSPEAKAYQYSAALKTEHRRAAAEVAAAARARFAELTSR